MEEVKEGRMEEVKDGRIEVALNGWDNHLYNPPSPRECLARIGLVPERLKGPIAHAFANGSQYGRMEERKKCRMEVRLKWKDGMALLGHRTPDYFTDNA